MEQKYRIRLNSTDSVNSVNKSNKVDVELQQSTKPLIFTSLKDEIDQYELFEKERENCSQYRIITTINPFCTNILYNPMTEIVYNEGDSDCIIVDDKSGVKEVENGDKCYGKVENVKRYDMISNTEYSREIIGYEYHPGVDIFNNHILRNKSFKIVNPFSKDYPEKDKDKFNTIEDYLRDYNGNKIKFKNRTNLTNFIDEEKHLYDYDDIMSFTDSINNNIMEDNGWFGFVNKSTIVSKKKNGEDDNKRIKWDDEDFNHVINNKESCEFIDLYPDRTLFSFNPKYNIYRKRPEYNWDLCITYPYENFYNHKLVKDNDGNNGVINALLISSIEYTTSSNGENIILFQTYTKHNLHVGDFINIYHKKDKQNERYFNVKEIRITNIGDLKNDNKEHYFYTTDLSLLNDIKEYNDNTKKYENKFSDLQIYEQKIYEYDENKKKFITKPYSKSDLTIVLNSYVFRFTHLINGYESEYYIRKFKKINKNIDKEQYQLAFASTIFNDKKTQISFTEGINTEDLLDNRGRPLSELFLTIIKNNRGNKEWYKTKNVKVNDNIEYSHCFSDVSCGFDLSFKNYEENAENSDVKTITNNNINDYNSKFGWDYLSDKDNKIDLLDITSENEYFIGDLVEFNITNCNEVVLEDCNFRFNTYMREHGDCDGMFIFKYDEIETDDYDSAGFKVNDSNREHRKNMLIHPEGYYYKAHYRIPIKEFGGLHQASHFDLKIKSMELTSLGEESMLKIKTTLPHKLYMNNTLLICDDDRNRILKTNVVYVDGDNILGITNVGKLTCKNIYDILNGKYSNINFKLRRYNEEIPFYAEKYPNANRYMWRDINNIGNMDNTTLMDYPFANGYFYINQDINFYLKRQDPFNKIGLYYKGDISILPNDILGDSLNESEYEYKDETEAKC